MSADLVIRNGLVVDGTGAPARRVDVAIDGDRIIEVGDDILRGRREIDAEGLLVTPGFVDPHTHYDGQATWDPLLAPSSHHGVTTVTMGNCGVGFAPVALDRHDWLIEMMEGVEDIPGTALHEGLRWGWESFPEYLDALDRQPRTIDVGTHVPHAALRGFVMGDRGADAAEQPSEDELRQMADLLKQGLGAGAIGISTSRTERHRTSTGENLGTLRAREPELQALASVLRATNKGVFQLVSDSYRTTDDHFATSEFSLIAEFARTSQRPVSYTVQQDRESPERWRDLMALAESLQLEGLDVKAQVAPRPIGVLLGLEASANVFTPAKAYARIADLPLAERVRALSDPDVRQKVLQGHRTLTSGDDAFAGFAFFARFDDMYVLDEPVNYDLDASQSLGATARRMGLDPREYAYDVQLLRDGRQLIYTPLFNFVGGNLDAVHEMITSPVAMFGLSDGGAHCGAICDASMTTSYMTLWARDRCSEEKIPIESVVHQLTRRPASHFGWFDRGLVAPGLLADLNVIDFESLSCASPEIVTDLPAGGRRLLQSAKGYRWTVKRGAVTFEDGVSTGQLPGKLIRGTQPGPR
ncbi:MAG TPA: amidohydrolase family protein [Acidimicrobiales bacterium]|nr:amidohydrolase family protein [Acidimicrobiales bacterium]